MEPAILSHASVKLLIEVMMYEYLSFYLERKVLWDYQGRIVTDVQSDHR